MSQSSKEAKARYREKNRELLRAKGREYAKTRYADPEFAARARAVSQEKRLADPVLAAEVRRRSYLKHADKRKAERREWYAANRERALAWAAEHYRSRNESARPYRSMDDVPSATERKKRKAEMDRLWRQNNRERDRINSANSEARRRAAKKSVEHEHIDRITVWNRDGGRCHICGGKCPRHDFHLDHLIPISAGGAHLYSNVAVSHPACNLARGPGRLPAQLLLIGEF